MEDKSLYGIEMQGRIVGFVTDVRFQAEIHDTPACSDLFTRAGVYHIESLNWQQKLEKSPKQFTIAGVDVKELAATNFSITAMVMSSYGMKINNTDLIGLNAFTYSNLVKKTPVAMLADLRYIFNFIEPNAEALADYKIDEDYTTELETLANKFEAVTKLPQAVIKQHADDKKQWVEKEKEINKFYDKEFDTFMQIYRIADVTFYLAYTSARHVRHHHLKRKAPPIVPIPTTGTLETYVVMKITLVPLAEVSLFIDDNEVAILTDGNGETYSSGLAPGVHHGKLVKTDLKDVVFDFTIVAGKTSALQFMMEAADSEPDVPPVS